MTKSKSTLRWSLVIIFGWLYVIGIGSIEGKFFPVVDRVNLEVIDNPEVAQPAYGSWLIAKMDFYKLREVCVPLRIEWSYGDRINPGVAMQYIWGEPEVRLNGYHEIDDMLIKISDPAVLVNFTHSDVIHRCGFIVDLNFIGINFRKKISFFWETRTPFWR